ncbi:MAG: DeoR/GlpR transcriptional regulator [Thalassovita sp.]
MSQSFRQTDILEFARQEGKLLVEDLAQRFGVTVQTIRRDLSELAEAGHLERVHGGAVLRSGVRNIGYEDRRSLNEEAKVKIATACAAEIPDGASLFLNIGTSTEAVARALLGHENLMVVTNNMNVANILATNSSCEIIVTGGSLRRSDGGLIGTLAARSIQQFKFDYAVVGCSAVDSDGDILDFDIQEVSVSQTIISQARKVFLLADQSKFQRSAPARIDSIQALEAIFTDATPSDALMSMCADWDTQVIVCD